MRKEQRAGDTLKNTTVKIGIILMVAIILATKEGERERNKINRRKKKDTEVVSMDSSLECVSKTVSTGAIPGLIPVNR